MSKEDCHTCGEEFEDNCEFCSFAYPFCSLECYDKYDEGAAMDNKRISEIVEEEMIKQDVNRYRDMRKILTIPKSIADALDKVPFHNPIAQLSNKYCDLTDFNDTVKRYAWNNKENGYICIAYITGKALGVDLVKVVEGIDDNY